VYNSPPRHVVPDADGVLSWRGTLVQYTGGLHRLHRGKSDVRIFDYVDRDVAMLLRMFKKRLRGYRAIGYARGEAARLLRAIGDHDRIRQ
jgi:superfamily II DNA or RNA helicase